MKKMINNNARGGFQGVWGWLYEVDKTSSTPEERELSRERINSNTLAYRKTGENSKNPGTLYIGGSIKIATDEACTNIIEIRYPYVAETYPSGKENSTYKVLKRILDGELKSVMESSKEEAAILYCTPTIEVQSYYTENRNGGNEPELVNFKIFQGGFINILDTTAKFPEDELNRAAFEVDMFITSVKEIEPDSENNIAHKLILNGAIFNYANKLMPVEFTVNNESGINYFLNCDISSANPLFTKVRGRQISSIIKYQKTETGAWGEPIVSNYSTTRKEWEVVWSDPDGYEYPSEDTLMPAELQSCMQERELMLANEKQRFLDRQKNKVSAPVAAARPVQSVAIDDFNF